MDLVLYTLEKVGMVISFNWFIMGSNMMICNRFLKLMMFRKMLVG